MMRLKGSGNPTRPRIYTKNDFLAEEDTKEVKMLTAVLVVQLLVLVVLGYMIYLLHTSCL